MRRWLTAVLIALELAAVRGAPRLLASSGCAAGPLDEDVLTPVDAAVDVGGGDAVAADVRIFILPGLDEAGGVPSK